MGNSGLAIHIGDERLRIAAELGAFDCKGRLERDSGIATLHCLGGQLSEACLLFVFLQAAPKVVTLGGWNCSWYADHSWSCGKRDFSRSLDQAVIAVGYKMSSSFQKRVVISGENVGPRQLKQQTMKTSWFPVLIRNHLLQEVIQPLSSVCGFVFLSKT